MTKDEAILATYKGGKFKYDQFPSMISWEKAQSAMEAYAASEVEKKASLRDEIMEQLPKVLQESIELRAELAAKDAEIAGLKAALARRLESQREANADHYRLEAELKRLREGIRGLQIRAWDAMMKIERSAVNKGSFAAKHTVWDDATIKGHNVFIGEINAAKTIFNNHVEALLTPSDGEPIEAPKPDENEPIPDLKWLRENVTHKLDENGLLPCLCCNREVSIFLEPSKDGTIVWHKALHGPTVDCSVSMIASGMEDLRRQWNKREGAQR